MRKKLRFTASGKMRNGLAALAAGGALLLSHSLKAQDYVRRPPDLDRLTQELFAEIQSDEVPYEDLYETLLQYYQTPINLNTATLAELDTLPGVGPVLAQRILAAREARGGFKAVSDLRKVDGIGDARFQQLKELVTV